MGMLGALTILVRWLQHLIDSFTQIEAHASFHGTRCLESAGLLEGAYESVGRGSGRSMRAWVAALLWLPLALPLAAKPSGASGTLLLVVLSGPLKHFSLYLLQDAL